MSGLPSSTLLSTSRNLGQSGGEVAGPLVPQNHSDCPRVAKHALVLGPSGYVQRNPSVPAQPAKSVNSALQSNSSQESVEPKRLAPRASTVKEQGFSEAMAARIEAKWTIFTKWCLTNQVDFRVSPVKSIANFLLYLFQGRKLQPCTIDDYISAIADKLGNSPIQGPVNRSIRKNVS